MRRHRYGYYPAIPVIILIGRGQMDTKGTNRYQKPMKSSHPIMDIPPTRPRLSASPFYDKMSRAVTI
jgi:hypothetical protein